MPRNKKPTKLTLAQEDNRAKLANAKARRQASEPERKAHTKARLAANYQKALQEEVERRAELAKPWKCGVCRKETAGDQCQHCGALKGSWPCSCGHANGPQANFCSATVTHHERHFLSVCGRAKPNYDRRLSDARGRTCSD